MSSSKMYISGDYNINVPAHLNFGKYILDRLRCYGDSEAIEDGETNSKITFKEIVEHAVKLSIALTRLGVRKGDVVALCSEPQLMFIPTALAILLSGAAYTPIDSSNGKYHLRHKLSIIKPKFCITSDLFWKNNCETLKTFDCIEKNITLDYLNPEEPLLSIKSMISLIDEDIDAFEPVNVVGQIDPALILFSSGTTGIPKGVEISHLNALIHASHYPFKSESIKVAYFMADWYHSYHIQMAYKTLVRGIKIIYTVDCSPKAIIKTIINAQANVAFFVPSTVILLSKIEQEPNENLDSFKHMLIAGSTIHANTLDNFKKRFPTVEYILQGYGSTEIDFITSQNEDHKRLKLGSVGSVCPGVTIKVVNPETQKLMGPNQQGELYVKGPALMKGYSGIDPATYIDEDGFFKTGDLGYYDEEEDFYIVDRLKHIIDYDGYKIAPSELEGIILMHPGVKEVAVVGKKVPIYGEVPCAFVVRKAGSYVTEQQIIDFLTPEVSQYMQLTGGVKFIPLLPKNAHGKILLQELGKMLQDF